MPSDKILHRIQLQINELAPTLELFVDDNIQPSVQDCESLQKQLTALQENVAVYKYNKQNKEISPSFNIHAKLSAAVAEKEILEEKKTEIIHEIKETPKPEKEKIEIKQETPQIPKTEPVKTEIPKTELPKVEVPKVELPKTELPKTEAPKAKLPLAIGINDKFRFMNELFSQNSSEYNIALEQLNNVNSWNEGEIYLNSLKSVYGWEENDEVVKYFFSVVKKRFE